MTYEDFLASKRQGNQSANVPFKFRPRKLFDFQKALVEWALVRGSGALFADCGLGKTPMQLTWAQNIVESTNQRVLILTPLAVGGQTAAEGEKFGVEVYRSRDGKVPATASVVVTNYEKLHLFSPGDFAGVVCDESSILKSFRGATQQAVTQFMLKTPHRLLCTATASPNDYSELGCSSEALGELGMRDMLSRFFKQDDNYHQLHALKNEGKRALAVSGTGGAWRLKPHAMEPFWQWVSSWARACRRPSDLGFSDKRFQLPQLVETDHVIEARRPADGMLFTVPARGLQEERDERRRTLDERVALAAQLVKHDAPAVVWCHMNNEGEALESAIPGCVQVSGADSDDQKEEAFTAFARGDVRVMVIKPKIGAWGLNWQHCAHVVTFASHSYEQYYQSVRRCWRFGQTRDVKVDIIFTEGETRVRENMLRKAAAADVMFAELVRFMQHGQRIATTYDRKLVEVPTWLRV